LKNIQEASSSLCNVVFMTGAARWEPRVILTSAIPIRAGFTADVANCPVNLCLPESSFSSRFQ